MDIKVKGGQILSGEITPSGSKNSAVHILPATLMFTDPVELTNVPEITDVEKILKLLEKLGSKVAWDKKAQKVIIDSSKVTFKHLADADIGKLKGTALLWGPMLARFKKVAFENLPGGCTLGIRPLDTHYLAFADLGVKIKQGVDFARMDASQASAREIWLNEMSPTATDNVIMLATSLPGTTRIIGAASEPQVQDLCEFLVKAGARIDGIGSNIVTVEGGRSLTGVKHELLSDHYEITTFIALAAATGGALKINKALPGRIENIIATFEKFGVKIKYQGDQLLVPANQEIYLQEPAHGRALDIKAQPWPGLPVDTLPLFIPLALAAKSGQVLFHNWMYEAGLFWTSELTKMGANIVMADPHRVLVSSGCRLTGATLEAPYIIRAVVAMVMMAMIARGESTILNADALYRGHPHFAENLRKLGAKIEVVNAK